jgi:hypothetical protein
MGDRHRDGDSRQIHRSVDPDAEVLIQTVPDVVRSAAGVPQTDLADGWYGRPFSMPDGLRGSVASLNAGARRDVADRIFADRIDSCQVAASRIGRDQFLRVPVWDGVLRLPGEGAKVGQSQIVSSAETPDVAETPAVPTLGG